MKTLKKLFSVSAIVALLGTLAPMYAFGATYSDELQDAYKYAYAHKVTTMTSIDNANMYGNLTRIALAKMIANYATDVLGMTPDTSAKCTFTDVTAALDAQYDNWVTKACQLGLMGQGITAFRPNDLVNRWEFGTTLSRALNADSDELEEMNAATPFYKKHLEFLKSEGIMTQIDNPNQTEVRGYVMLMMMRADDSYSPDTTEGCTAEELLACITADDYDACIAACSDEAEEEEQDPEEVKAGTLNVTMTSEKGGDVPYGISALPVVTYTLKAADEDINISSLVLSQAGYGHEDTIEWAALFINGQRVSKVKNLDLNKDLTLNLTSAYTVKAGKSVDIEVRVTLGTSDDAKGSQFAVKLEEVQSSAEKVKLPSNVTSNTFKIVSTSASEVEIAARNPVDAPKAGTTKADIFEFSIAWNSTQDVTVKNITFVWLGGWDKNTNAKDYKDFLKNIKLLLDDEVVATAEMNGKYLTFNVSKDVVIEKSKTEIFTVQADVIGWAGETLDFGIEDAMDVVIYGNTYNAPVTIVWADSDFAAVDILAGKVVIERTNPTETTFVKNTKNVYLGSFTVNNNGDNDLTLEKMWLKVTYAGTPTNYIESIKVRYGSANAGSTELTLKDWVYTDDTEVSIWKKVSVYVYADIAKEAALDWDETFYVSLDKDSFKIVEDENDNVVREVSFPASFATMEASTSALTVTKVSLGDKSYSKWTTDIEAVSFKVKTSTTAGVKIKNLVFNADNLMENDPASATPAEMWVYDSSDHSCTADGFEYDSEATDEVNEAACEALVATPEVPAWTQATYKVDSNTIRNAKLVVNDKDEYDATIGSDTITVKSPITLEANTTTTFVLKVSLESEPKVTEFKYTFDGTNTDNFVAEDTTSDRNPIEAMWESAIAGRKISVLSAWTVTLDYEATNANNKNAKTILAGDSAIVAEYNLYATHEQAKAKNIELTFSTNIDDNVDDVEVYYGNELVASNPTWSTNVAKFTNVNLTIKEDETPLTVKVVSTKINSDGWEILETATLDKVTLKGISWKTSGIAIDDEEEAPTAPKEFAIVPVTLLAEATTTTANTNTLSITANRGSNTTTGNVAAKAILWTITFGVSSNNALDHITVKDSEWNVVCEEDTNINDDVACVFSSDYTLSNWKTDFTVEGTIDNLASNVSYTLSVKSITYTTNVDDTVNLTYTTSPLLNVISK